jgi:Protein of unknown function (DUF4232)
MNITTRLGRRLAVGFGLAGAAILLPTAALASSAHSAAAAHQTVRAVAPAACTSNHTRVWLGVPGDGSAGHVTYQLELSNIGHTACSLFGYPGVSALNMSRHEVGKPATHSGGRLLVTLSPGATAHVVLVVTDAGAVCSHPLNASMLRVFAPGQTHAEFVPLTTQACKGKSLLRVDSVHPRAGIPGFSAS